MKGIIKQVLLATCVIGAPTCVYAFPFQTNPQSFQSYMNTRNWKDGSKAYFENVNTCSESGPSDARYYYCTSGFITITNPKGRMTCDLTILTYSSIDGTYNYRMSGCRYK